MEEKSFAYQERRQALQDKVSLESLQLLVHRLIHRHMSGSEY